VRLKNWPLAPDAEATSIARATSGFSGADLANLVNEAALLAARRDKRFVTMSDLEEAKDKVMMGAERRSMVMSEAEKTLTAYHEGGHALVMLSLEHHDPLHKVSIVPRGRALGVGSVEACRLQFGSQSAMPPACLPMSIWATRRYPSLS